MTTPRETTNLIKDFLTSQKDCTSGEVKGWAVSYAEYCKMANARLRRCADYLRQGLLAEAIHHAEIKPDALDLAGDLDLPQFDHWYDYCRQQQLDLPERILTSTAAELNAAYSTLQPMEELLAKQRALALARAPIRDRLQVLRALARADASNSFWEQDLEAYESRRITELLRAAREAAKSADRPRLKQIYHELVAPDWHKPVPRHHLDQVYTTLHQ